MERICPRRGFHRDFCRVPGAYLPGRNPSSYAQTRWFFQLHGRWHGDGRLCQISSWQMVPEGCQEVIGSSPQSITDAQVIDRIFSRLAEAEKPLPRSLEFYRQMLTAQKKVKKPDLLRTLTALKEKAPQRLAQGKPLLHFREISINWREVQKLFQAISGSSDGYIL